MKRISLSFKTKVFLSGLLVALIPLILSSVVMMRLFTASLNRQSDAQAHQKLEAITSRFSSLWEECEEACRALAEDGSAAWSMVDNTTVDIRRDMYLSLYQAVQEVYSHAQFSIYDVGGKLRFTTDTGDREDFLPVYWGLLKKASEAEGITYYCTDPNLSITAPDVLLQGAYPLETAHGVRMGYVVMDFTREDFDNVISGFRSLGDMVLILDSHQKPVYCSNPEYGGRQLEQLAARAMEDSWEEIDGYNQSLWQWEPEHGFYVILCRQAPISAPAIETMGTVMFALSVLSLILCLGISEMLSRTITQPVRCLDKAMEELKGGDLSVRVYSRRKDELGRLAESFNRMVRDLNTYLEDRVQQQKDLNEITLKLYQTQLNPHFLYNTLDTIRWNGKINQIPEISVLAENLAVILRKSISGKPFIPLKEELETIESYICIQKIRFTGRFLYETEIPGQLEECLIPKMILQPLVENAIIHGLDGSENGYICVYGARDGEDILISVTDDGRGMSREMLDWINSPNPQKRDGHLGLYNVIYILKLYYGDQYGVKASAAEDGTTITLRLPFRKEVPDV